MLKKLFRLGVNGLGRVFANSATRAIGERIAQVLLIPAFIIWGFFILLKKEKKLEEFIFF